ncbi:peptide chain release factor N(5)-glutamine methyltransferase [Aquibacillus albus]|nr:peptide chain release factor N(5)-glutamine methyltransferase [Aquibacillus albus]
MKTMQIHEALSWASLFLQEHNREPKVAEILLLHHLSMTKVQLLSSLREPIPAEKQEAFIQAIHIHAETGVPVQHLTGTETFYGRSFRVNQHVLIPRPETEELVEGVLAYVDSIHFPKPTRVLDIGTGSGIIAITLKLERPDLQVYASDISEQALAVAADNAQQLGADISFEQGDFLEPFLNKQTEAQIIVSNPPYIPYEEEPTLSDTVKNFDPELALFAEDDGLAAYKKMVQQSEKILQSPGLLAFEIGYQQGEAVRALIHNTYPESKAHVRKDINKKDRMVFATL